MIHVLSIHNIIRHSQKKMTEKNILYVYFILEQTSRNQCTFLHFQRQIKNKIKNQFNFSLWSDLILKYSFFFNYHSGGLRLSQNVHKDPKKVNKKLHFQRQIKNKKSIQFLIME